MKSRENLKGAVYRCAVCGAEIVLLAAYPQAFRPRCCNQEMARLSRRLTFYVCPVCGAEISVLKAGTGSFSPRCCNTDMVAKAA